MGKFATLCELLPAEVNWGDPITPQMVDEIIMAEREACAKVCEEHMGVETANGQRLPPDGSILARAIRKRHNV